MYFVVDKPDVASILAGIQLAEARKCVPLAHNELLRSHNARPEHLGDLRSGRARRHAHYVARKWLWKSVILGTLVAKRIVESAISAVALIVLIPFFALVAALIKATDAGPVLFWQRRVGQWGKEFAFPKFRSMVADAERRKPALRTANEHGDGITFKMKRDPRVTWIGRIIRKYSIDELPQFWCVLRGDLSLVGPRPAIPSEVAKYTLADRRRLDIRPGLTCLWQVSGRSLLGFDRQVALDVEYIHKQSFLVDLFIVLRTIPAVLTGRGAF